MSIEYRKSQLRQLALMINENKDLFLDACQKDGKVRGEVEMVDIVVVLSEIKLHLACIDSWSRPKSKWDALFNMMLDRLEVVPVIPLSIV